MLGRSRRPEPGGERVSEPEVRSVPHPGNISVGPDQHGGGSGDRAKYRKIPFANIFRVDHLNPIGPWSDVEAAGLTEVEQHWPGIVQQGEYPQRAVGGDQVEIGHAAPEQRVSLTEVVMDVQTGHHRGESFAGLVHAEEFGNGVAQGLGAVVWAAKKRHLRHRGAQHARSDRVPFGMIGIEEAVGRCLIDHLGPRMW